MRFSYKVQFGYILGAVIIGTVGIVGVRGADEINKHSEIISEHVLPTIKALDDIRYAGLRIISSVVESGLLENAATSGRSNEMVMQVEQQQIGEGEELYRKSFDNFAKLVAREPDEKHYIEKIGFQGESLHREARVLLDLIHHHADKSDIFESKERFEEIERNFLHSVNSMLAQEYVHLDKIKNAETRSISSTARTTGILSFIAVITGLGFGYRLSLAIVRPLKLLREGAAKIERGDLEEQINVKSSDEVGELAAAFEKMRIELKTSRDNIAVEIIERQHAQEELNRAKNHLEERVKERTDDLNRAYDNLFTEMEQRKRSDNEREKMQVQLNQAQKMEFVGRLAGGIAHDFNNLLTVILGYADIALMQTDPTHPLFDNLEEIRKAGERSADLTRQLLAYSRQQTIEPKVLDLNEIVSGMLKMLQRLIGESIDLNWHPFSSLWYTRLDPSQVDQIIANLCINARDAIEDVGKITINTGNSVIDEDYIALHPGLVPGEYVWIAVSDNGCGMDKETLSRIFEPFFTTKGVGKGTGLGLATVFGIVKQNNGYVDVQSEPGSGTTFRIYMPRHVGTDEQILSKDDAKPIPHGQESILLVEDDPSILKLATKILSNLGYRVLTANNPVEAINLAREHEGEVHLVLTDVVMPEMNGRDLTQNLLSINPQIKCMYMSGYTGDIIGHHGVLNEGEHFIQKPFTPQRLAIKVREVLDGN
ncbi:MAG: ATP-binding protein [Desulfuromonadaceae bacterium]|nr:ATP-binding protein [Desulfuromonadaceae bacterium]MDD5106766.1 ATP-binding protein [Desulfuromonadaceae bacterium]